METNIGTLLVIRVRRHHFVGASSHKKIITNLFTLALTECLFYILWPKQHGFLQNIPAKLSYFVGVRYHKTTTNRFNFKHFVGLPIE